MNRVRAQQPLTIPTVAQQYIAPAERAETFGQILQVELGLRAMYNAEFLYVGETELQGSRVAVFELNWGGIH